MTKLLLLVTLAAELLKPIFRAFASLFHSTRKETLTPEPLNEDWYGNCQNCGKKDGLHRFQGKRYCAVCHARIKTEYDFAKKKQVE